MNRDFGRINDCWVARKPPGFGFVWFDSERDAVRCLHLFRMRVNNLGFSRHFRM
jgi:hypothetical protein